VQVELGDHESTLELPVTVLEVTPEPGSSERPWVRLRFDSQCQSLMEAFVFRCDPSADQLAPDPRRVKLKVAVIDDNKIQREIASKLFRDRGHDVVEAEDGLSGLAVCLKHEPDVILSDVQMPRADGWQLLRMLRARKKFARVPVLFLTTLSAEKDRLHGYRLGVDDYVEKPYSEADLLARVERCIRRSMASMRPMAAVDALRGNLEHVGLPALLSFLELEQKTGTLNLQDEGGFVVLKSGKPVRAFGRGHDSRSSGVEALYVLLDLTQGGFEFVPGEVTEEDSVKASLSLALMEHARRTDEAAAGRVSA
jgi:DNA-binding response OmpR family regulator